MPMIMASAVIRTGRKRVAPAWSAARTRVAMFSELLLGEGDDQNAVRGGDAHAHDGSHQCGDAERGVGDEEEQNDAGQRRGQRGNDDERVQPGLEIHDDQQVDQNDGEGQSGKQRDIGTAHGIDLAVERHEGSARQRALARVDDFFHIAADGAQVAALHRAVNVDHAADVVVIDDGHFVISFQAAISARISSVAGAPALTPAVLRLMGIFCKSSMASILY